MYTQLRLCVTCCVTVLVTCVLETLSNPLSENFVFPNNRQGEFAQVLGNYEISIPRKVDESGDFLSHTVHHRLLPVQNGDDGGYRRKRDIVDDSLPHVDTLHYKINVEGEDLHVTLKPNHKLIAPGLVIERRKSRYGNLTDSSIKRFPNNPCHFTGEIKGSPGSQVALATCHGLHGMLHTSKGDYFIEPVKDHDLTKDEGRHPHLIYKRSALPEELHIQSSHHKHHHETDSCGVKDQGTSEEDQRQRWEDHHRKKRTSSEHHRSKRSISMERNIEVLVVVDKKMMEYYMNEDIETYVLTIMNIVSNMYHDSTIGNAVNIVLVRLMLLEEDEPELKITHHADNTLASFCKWQLTLNPKDDKHPNHHDVAVLLTRFNICSRMNEPCSTLGLSQVSGLCQPHRSCNINEDTGLALAFTVAHELGHNFGMHHDGADNGCLPVEGEFQHVMSPQLNAEASPLIWSNCSRAAITRFLDRDWGYCLDDAPSDHDFEFPVLPPGVMYDVDHQCRLQYGPDAEFCDGIDEACTTIWCKVDNKCLTRLEAAAQGTVCGENRWCFAGDCTTIDEKPESVNGEWGSWAEWTQCSRSCGAGITYSERLCNNPPPRNGGKYCLGERKRYRICNTDACEEGSKSYRSVQCTEFNYIPYKGALYEWEPVSTPATPCQLNCKPNNKFFSVLLRDTVQDGTPCRTGSRDMCINGHCQKVGCDWVLESAAKEDRCGICHGDGSSCKMVKNEFSDSDGLGYVEAMVIPAGARHIRVEEVAEANNYLAVKNDNGDYYLNGHWFIQWSGDYDAAGTVIHYNREGNKESFMAPGPTKEDLHIMLLFQSQNPGVTFEYTVPNDNITELRKPEFHWRYMDWTHCTSSCGGGVQRSEVVCVEMEAGVVDDVYCNISSKPDDMRRVCNDHLCPARWWYGPWQRCSVSCGAGGVHKRTVICVRRLGPDEQIALEDHDCEDQEKPVRIEPCRRKDPCPETLFWQTGEWSDACNKGDPCAVETRNVWCSLEEEECEYDVMPEAERQCSNMTCGYWSIDDWSECTRSCGGGIQFRSVTCKNGEACLHASEPISEQRCNEHQCAFTGYERSAGDANIYNVMMGEDSSVYEADGDVLDTLPEGAVVTSTTTDKSVGKTEETELQNNNDADDTGKVNEEGTTTDKTTKTTTKVSEKTEAGEENKVELYRWVPLFWGECSVPCGHGVQTRQVRCIEKASMEEVESGHCEGLAKPNHERTCQKTPCLEWQVSDWTQCTVTCGEGVQAREITCPQLDKCAPGTKPEMERTCSKKCTDWVAGPWSQCSRRCGGGEQARMVQCVDQTNQSPVDGLCSMDTKPIDKHVCNEDACAENKNAALEAKTPRCKSDVLSYAVCKALKKMGKCKESYIELRCCKTCFRKPQSKPKSITNS